MQSSLHDLLESFRKAAKTSRELGDYFEELIQTYLRYEPTYASLYSDVWLLSDVPDEFGISKQDTGIDLVARTHGTGEFHAIQCKFYAEDHIVKKSDIDSFFTASGQKPFSHRVIVVTSNNWSKNAEAALFDQQPPVNCIDLHDLESSQIDWSKFKSNKPPTLVPKYSPKGYQEPAIKDVLSGLSKGDRGKLIMACGTGKTFTSLKIAEEIAGKGKRVLFLVPSLALLSQTLTEWSQQSEAPLHSFAVCSDAEVGKKRKKDDDVVHTFVHELRYPATTNSERLAAEMSKRHDSLHMSVVFSTYHSIQVIHEAQHKHGLDEFDLIICDEAHRTTGATYLDEQDSPFVRVHDADFIRAKKRLYMTATPRIYSNAAEAKAIQDNVELYSMSNEEVYGKQLHAITFSEAVELGELTDYKVIVLTIDEDHVSERLQDLLKDDDNQLKVDDAARIIGCWKALSKQNLDSDLGTDTGPMQKAVAFCQVIEPSTGKKSHKVSSKQVSEMFQSVIDAYQESADEPIDLRVETQHVDGSMNATAKEDKIRWLKDDADPNTCRILSNVRCLSEGVDVPALDAVLFLSPRSSQVEVVQSVGRVMRKAPGKKLGYVVLPVVIPASMTPSEALEGNKAYKVVWEVLQALRSHDDRMDADVNKVDLMNNPMPRMEVVAITNTLSPKAKKANKSASGKGEFSIGLEAPDKAIQRKLQFEVDGLERALYAKLVKKCGNRAQWEDWANDIADIAGTHISRITAIVNEPKNKREIAAFNDFANEIRDDLNDSISDGEVIEMLAQHLITKPVFDALFSDYSFASNNPVSKGMQEILDLLQEHRLDKEADTLEKFYASVRRRADGIDKAEGKQKIVVELYDKFFRNAFPRMTERLGIVYTPVEVVDFIIHSVNDILQEEFGQTLGSEGVHILDPFVGTGTFITRLMQSGLITPEQLPHKYKHEIHCNEIVLLAYYIAAINIEAVYHSIMSDHHSESGKSQAAGSDVGGEAAAYEPFEGILLTDTFAMYESDDLIEQFFPDNSERRKRQKKLPIRVIVGNPPYASADKDETGVKATSYAGLDGRIAATYVAASSNQMGKSKIYDSYIRAIRWASDRIGNDGLVGFVTNAGFLEASATDGIRKCLYEEFDQVYVFHLRGNQRTSGELSRREGGKIFGSGSRSPIAVTILVKKAKGSGQAKIQWRDIGDYLSQDEKLAIVSEYRSIAGIAKAEGWVEITPDEHSDWINQRDNTFDAFIAIGDKKHKPPKSVFKTYSMGVKSNRDDWVFNASKESLRETLQDTIVFYNSESRRIRAGDLDPSELSRDKKRIKWTSDLVGDAAKGVEHVFDESAVRQAMYRPFTKQWSYFDASWNWTRHLMHEYFPEAESCNLVIWATCVGATVPYSAWISKEICSLQQGPAAVQHFPLYTFEEEQRNRDEKSLFSDAMSAEKNDAFERRDAITDSGLKHFQDSYGASGKSAPITKEDLFYYVYGLLHSPEYRERYEVNLRKDLARIPAVKKFEDFQAFSQAGRDLAHWHLDYETVDCHPVTLDFTAGDKGPQSLKACKDEHFYVHKMKFPRVKDPETKKSVNNKTTVIYNDYITVRDIPLEAYDYVVNGKSAIEWVMERQAVTTDTKSGITNDANLWATETMSNAAYPLELLQRVITVSLETMKIVNSLPPLDIDDRIVDPKEFLASQIGSTTDWNRIYETALSYIGKDKGKRLRLSEVAKIADVCDVGRQEVLAVLNLLTAPEANLLHLEYRQFKNQSVERIDATEVTDMLTKWWREKSLPEDDWREWASTVEMSWVLASPSGGAK